MKEQAEQDIIDKINRLLRNKGDNYNGWSRTRSFLEHTPMDLRTPAVCELVMMHPEMFNVDLEFEFVPKESRTERVLGRGVISSAELLQVIAPEEITVPILLAEKLAISINNPNFPNKTTKRKTLQIQKPFQQTQEEKDTTELIGSQISQIAQVVNWVMQVDPYNPAEVFQEFSKEYKKAYPNRKFFVDGFSDFLRAKELANISGYGHDGEWERNAFDVIMAFCEQLGITKTGTQNVDSGVNKLVENLRG